MNERKLSASMLTAYDRWLRQEERADATRKISAQHPSLCCVAGQRGGHEGCRDGMEGTFSPAAASTIYHQHRACRAERPAPLPRLGGLPRKFLNMHISFTQLNEK